MFGGCGGGGRPPCPSLPLTHTPSPSTHTLHAHLTASVRSHGLPSYPHILIEGITGLVSHNVYYTTLECMVYLTYVKSTI